MRQAIGIISNYILLWVPHNNNNNTETRQLFFATFWKEINLTHLKFRKWRAGYKKGGVGYSI